jgi:Predicted integral membrane protein
MASIIPGYEYDIFISYRKNDNKRDGWVTEFTENLKQELEATLKEQLSVYFDENQHDGLLETDNVNKSLEGKLKCLIFIPIISQTYCDPKSFAWQHEFCVFNKSAKADQFGRDVRLTNGNVACRILSVKIHDLDMNDKKLYEDETGEQIRGIEFIFRQPGVNRPLRPDDIRKDNLNRIVYRDQVNKLANSVKEILNTLKNFNSGSNAVNEKLNNGVSDIKKRYSEDNTKRNSIIVLPFENMSPDPQNNYFSDGLTEEIISNLAHLRSLRVISRSTSMVFKGTSKDVITIGRELNVEYVLAGSVRKAENKIRITAQLIDARLDEHIWAERFDGSMEDIFDVQDKIARLIVDALKIELSPEEKKNLISRPISNTMAYDLWILAKNEFNKLSKEGIDRGILLTKRAIEIEGDNAQLFATLAYGYWAYYDLGIKHETEIFDLMDDCVSKSLTLDPNNAEALSSKGLILYKQGNLSEYIRFAKPAADLGGDTIYLFSFILAELGRLEEADAYAEKALAGNPLIYMSLWTRACVNMFMGETQNAYDMIRYARDHFAPGEPFAGWWVAQIAALAGDIDTAYYEFKKVALSGSSPWQEFCKLFQLAIESNAVGVKEHIQNSGLADFSKTDEYYPICIANSLVRVGEYNEALIWLNRSVDWGFRNYKFLAEYNGFLEPLRTNSDFLNLIEKLHQKQEPFIDL